MKTVVEIHYETRSPPPPSMQIPFDDVIMECGAWIEIASHYFVYLSLRIYDIISPGEIVPSEAPGEVVDWSIWMGTDSEVVDSSFTEKYGT